MTKLLGSFIRHELLLTTGANQSAHAFAAMMGMKKIDVAAIEAAVGG
jgi:predicted 3-demethylubiquinone-9 3-methyltransferase (glyoxalase superfamily)